MTTQPPVVWTEIPATDMNRAVDFYNEVFGYDMTIDTTGPNPMAVLGGVMDTVGGHIYPGKPAAPGTGPTVHLVVPGKLEDAAARCTGAGGAVLSNPVEIPPGRFVYATDPDGNSIGLFEARE